MKIFKRMAVAALAASMLLAAGCEYTDPDRMAIITGAAIDYGDGMYEVTIESIKVQGSSMDEPIETETYTTKALSLDLAEAELERLTGSALYWGHAQALVISEQAAAEALAPILDWVMRSGDLRLTVVMAVSREEDAKSILGSDPSGSYTVASAIAGATRNGGFAERSAGSSTHRALEALLDTGSALLPAVRLAEQDEDRKFAVLDGGAVLVGSKLAGFLSEDEAQDILLLLGANDSRELIRDEMGSVGLKLEDINASAKGDTLEDGSALLNVSLKGGCIVEYYDAEREPLDEAGAKALTDAASAAMKERIIRAIEATRAFGADVADFGSQFERDYGDSAKDAALKSALEVSVELEITDTGLISRSPTSKLYQRRSQDETH